MRLIVNTSIMKLARWMLCNKHILAIMENNGTKLHNFILENDNFGNESGVYSACVSLGIRKHLSEISNPEVSIREIVEYILGSIYADLAIRISDK